MATATASKLYKFNGDIEVSGDGVTKLFYHEIDLYDGADNLVLTMHLVCDIDLLEEIGTETQPMETILSWIFVDTLIIYCNFSGVLFVESSETMYQLLGVEGFSGEIDSETHTENYHLIGMGYDTVNETITKLSTFNISVAQSNIDNKWVSNGYIDGVAYEL